MNVKAFEQGYREAIIQSCPNDLIVINPKLWAALNAKYKDDFSYQTGFNNFKGMFHANYNCAGAVQGRETWLKEASIVFNQTTATYQCGHPKWHDDVACGYKLKDSKRR